MYELMWSLSKGSPQISSVLEVAKGAGASTATIVGGVTGKVIVPIYTYCFFVKDAAGDADFEFSLNLYDASDNAIETHNAFCNTALHLEHRVEHNVELFKRGGSGKAFKVTIPAGKHDATAAYFTTAYYLIDG